MMKARLSRSDVLGSAGAFRMGSDEHRIVAVAEAEFQRLQSASKEPTRVRVTDIDMPFGSMVMFMVKWSLASIPALMILAAATFAVVIALATLAGTLGLAVHGLR